jgi:hypothetical protein
VANFFFDIVFYCQSPSHWQNVQPVIEYILKNNEKFSILLLAGYKNEDYDLAIYPEDLKKIFDVSLAQIKNINTKIIYTPFVGFPSYAKPVDSIVVHSLISLSGLDGVYFSDIFDGYDYILIAGSHQLYSFKEWRKNHNYLSGKKLIPSGYPKLDLIINRFSDFEINEINSIKTIIYAPTHIYEVNENLASLRKFGLKIIETLLYLGYRVIFRPHPMSLIDQDKDLVSWIVNQNSNNILFEFDTSKDYFNSYARSDLMITDLSGTGFTYSLGFCRPSFFFTCNVIADQNIYGAHQDARNEIGGVARSLKELIILIQNIENEDLPEKINIFREKYVYNLNNSATYITNFLKKLLSGNDIDDCILL